MEGNWTDQNNLPYVQHLQSSTDSPPPEDDTKLELFNLSLEDSGLYSCRVKNQYGGAVATGSVNVTLATSCVDCQAASTSHEIKYHYSTLTNPNNSHHLRFRKHSVALIIGLGGTIAAIFFCLSFGIFLKYR